MKWKSPRVQTEIQIWNIWEPEHWWFSSTFSMAYKTIGWQEIDSGASGSCGILFSCLFSCDLSLCEDIEAQAVLQLKLIMHATKSKTQVQWDFTRFCIQWNFMEFCSALVHLKWSLILSVHSSIGCFTVKGTEQERLVFHKKDWNPLETEERDHATV